MLKQLTIIAALVCGFSLNAANAQQTMEKARKLSATQVVQEVLKDPTNPDHVKPYIAEDFTYVSLNFENKDLQKIMPWAGTHKGPEGFYETFKGVNKFWNVDEFKPTVAFDDGENVAIFGTFTLTSKTLHKTRTSPFAIQAKVKNGKLTYFMYMEDTFATADTFKASGKSIYKSNPDGGQVEY